MPSRNVVLPALTLGAAGAAAAATPHMTKDSGHRLMSDAAGASRVMLGTVSLAVLGIASLIPMPLPARAAV
jgi:hypothetical protein